MGDIMDSARAKDLGVTIRSDFKPYKRCVSAASKARGELYRLT